MSQPGNTSDKSEVPPENTKGEQPEKRAPLSLSDLMSIKSAFRIRLFVPPQRIPRHHSRPPDKKSVRKAVSTREKTADITRLLNDKSIKREMVKKQGEESNNSGDYRWTDTRNVNASSNMGLFHPLGLRQHFNLRGVDVTKIEKEKQSEEATRLVEDFLKILWWMTSPKPLLQKRSGGDHP
ncbi:MAG: hypothetical protein R3F51_21800 [Cyanobacteriota/Melainabacteria group bacterium]